MLKKEILAVKKITSNSFKNIKTRKIAILISLAFIGCGKSQIDVTVRNQTEKDYDSVVIVGLGKIKFNNLKSYTSNSGIIDYSDSKSKTDGNYEIRIFDNGDQRSKQFGYYSNGEALSESFQIAIKKDTILIKELTYF